MTYRRIFLDGYSYYITMVTHQRNPILIENIEAKLNEQQRKAIATLENRYNAATKRALEAMKVKESTEGRRLLNEAHKHKKLSNQA